MNKDEEDYDSERYDSSEPSSLLSTTKNEDYNANL